MTSSRNAGHGKVVTAERVAAILERDALATIPDWLACGASVQRVKETMTTPNTDSTAGALVDDAETAGSKLAEPPARPNAPPIPTKAKNQNIHVSPAVLDAARKDGEELLRDLRTSPSGLTQTEAEERARTTGPNEVAQERKQGWPVRLLKIIRNPLVILLTTLVGGFLSSRATRAPAP